MKNKFMNPKTDIYLWGRYCDNYIESKETTPAKTIKDALAKVAKHYGMPVGKIKPLIIACKKRVGGVGCPI